MVEKSLDSLKSLYISILEEEGVPTMHLSVLSGAELGLLENEGFYVEKEGEGEWVISCIATE